MKRLSVIIPGYNTRREWWVRCARSVSAAVVKACGGAGEVLCVDDGSREPVDAAWFAGVPGVKVIRLEKNAGLPTARNAGLKAATGEFVTFVDSDDEVREETFVKCLAQLDETGADLAVYGVQSVFVDFKLTAFDIPEDKYYGALTPKDVAYLVKRRLFYYMCNKVFRRSFLDVHNMWVEPDGVPCEDAIFNVGCVVHQAKWVTVAYPGYVYYRYDGTICSSYKPTLVAGMNKCSAAWKAYKDATPGAYEALGKYDERSPQTVACAQWMNIWRPRNPYTVSQKWRWLRENSACLRGRPLQQTSVAWCVAEFVRKAMFMWARAHLYIRPVRRWYQIRGAKRIGTKFSPWNGK